MSVRFGGEQLTEFCHLYTAVHHATLGRFGRRDTDAQSKLLQARIHVDRQLPFREQLPLQFGSMAFRACVHNTQGKP